MNIAFIGTGVMGSSMAGHLMDGGHGLTVYNRTRAKAEALIEKGAAWKDTVADCVAQTEMVITMVGFPQDVEEVYFGEKGIIDNVPAGALLVDMTTTSPTLSQRIGAQAHEKGLYALDAPVSGGDVGAQKGTLSIMVGGEEEVFRRALPVLELMGTQIVYEGPWGAGQHTKMANQIAIAGTICGVCEAITYGRTMGLDLDRMLNSIGAGAAGSWQMQNLGPKMVQGDDAPGFFIKHMLKDLTLADQEAEAKGIHLEVLKTVEGMYRDLQAQGMGELGTQALMAYYKAKGMA